MYEPTNHKSTNHSTGELPNAVEILGPAGAGKTTLLRALGKRYEYSRPGIHLSRLNKIPYFISNTAQLLPTYLRHYRHTRWFDWRESRSMVFLQAGLQALERQESNHGTVTFLDHGPIYRLAFLRDFGPEITASQLYKKWWTSLLIRWVAALDLVILLDAPNEVLLERIHVRERWHMVKDLSEKEANEFLTRYRMSFERIMDESVAYRQVKLLRFDTAQETVDQIVDRVLALFEGAPDAA